MKGSKVMPESYHYQKSHPCARCDVKIKPTKSGLYHCNNRDCSVAHFKVDFYGNPYDITYCADIGEERI